MGIILLVAVIWVVVWFHFTRPEAPVPVRAGDRTSTGATSAQGAEAPATAPAAVPDAGDAGATSE